MFNKTLVVEEDFTPRGVWAGRDGDSWDKFVVDSDMNIVGVRSGGVWDGDLARGISGYNTDNTHADLSALPAEFILIHDSNNVFRVTGLKLKKLNWLEARKYRDFKDACRPSEALLRWKIKKAARGFLETQERFQYEFSENNMRVFDTMLDAENRDYSASEAQAFRDAVGDCWFLYNISPIYK